MIKLTKILIISALVFLILASPHSIQAQRAIAVSIPNHNNIPNLTSPILIGNFQQATPTPEAVLAQTLFTPTPLRPATDDGNVSTTISPNFYTALFGVAGFTCFSIILLIGLLWFLNKRRQA